MGIWSIDPNYINQFPTSLPAQQLASWQTSVNDLNSWRTNVINAESASLAPRSSDPYISGAMNELNARRTAEMQAHQNRYTQAASGLNTIANQATAKIATVPQRYQDIAAGYQQRYQDAQAGQSGWQSQMQNSLAQQAQQAQAASATSLANRGLSGQVSDSMNTGYQSDYATALGNLNEQGSRMAADQYGMLSADALGARDRSLQSTVDAAGQTYAIREQLPKLAAEWQSLSPSISDQSSYARALSNK
jgi:hypothetical protein